MIDEKKLLNTWLQAHAFDIGVSVELPIGALKHLELQLLETEANKLILQVKTWVVGKRHREVTMFKRIEFDVPASWWEHFKERFEPQWMKKRWPVKYQTLTQTVEWSEGPYFLCGHLSPNDRDHLKFLASEVTPK